MKNHHERLKQTKMSSPTPEASTSRKGINKKVKSSKKKSEHTPVVVTEHGKNEGDNPHWAYRPPAGAELLDHTIESEEFEWNVIRDNDDLEIWLIRVPDSVCHRSWRIHQFTRVSTWNRLKLNT